MDNLGILVQAILSLKDTTNSKNQIAKELPKLESRLQSDKNTRVKIVAGLDVAKSKNLIQSQLNTLANQAKAPAIKVGIDTSGLNSVQGATQNITNGLKNVKTKAQQAINNVDNLNKKIKELGNLTSSSSTKNYFSDNPRLLENIKMFPDKADAIKYLEETFKSLGATVTSVEKRAQDGNLDDFIVTVKSATGEIEKFYYAYANIKAPFEGAGDDWRYILTSVVATDQAVQKLITSEQKAQDRLKSTRKSLTSDLKAIRSAWQDVNGGKSVKSDENIEKLKQQYIKVTQTIRELRNADDTTLASMKANTNSQIDKLKQMVSQYHNAEKVATQLRAKGFETVKIDTGNNIDKFINSINNSKVPIQAMQTEINKLTSDFVQLDIIQDQAGKSAALTNVLNTLDNAKTKFQSLKELFKGFGNADWLSVNSEQINKINDMATKIAIYKNNLTATRDEWKSQGIYVGEIQSKVTSLARSLPNIKKPEKFNEWVQEWNDINQKANQLKVNLDSQVSTHNKIYEIQSQIAKLNPTKDSTEIARLNEKLSAEQKTLSNLQMQSNVYSNLVSLEQQEQYITEQTVKSRDKLLSATNVGVKQYQTTINNALSKLQGIANSSVFSKNTSNPQVAQTKQELADLAKEYQNLKAEMQGDITPAGLETLGSKLNKLNTRFNSACASAEQFERELKDDNSTEQLAQKVSVLTARIEAFRKANKKSEKLFGGEYDRILSQLSEPNIDLQTYNRLNKEFQKLRLEINKADKAGKNLWQTFKEKLTKFTGWMSMTYAVTLFTSNVRSAVSELKEMDSILTEISKTSDRTEESLKKLGKDSFTTASKYGRTASDYLIGVQEMSRAGFGEKESEQMAELSLLAQSAGDMTAELANEYLIATNAGYQLGGSAEKLNSVLDSQNFITNRNALNMSELAEATKIVSSQAAQSGIGIDEMTAAVGTMIATTQQGGEVAARSLKGILMNLQQVKGTADEIGDGGEDITTESLTKYEKACLDLGVALKEVKNGVTVLRDPMKILEELASAVAKESEDSIKVANLINAVGGEIICHYVQKCA